MIPNDILQTIDTFGDMVEPVGHYRITESNQARILLSLSDKMYTRKELAVIREYSNNGNDAHIVAGKLTSELLITLPTFDNLVFKVRDFGSGLSRTQIRDIYCVLGESTKRNSPEQNGVLGYGCKAGFAHSDSFTVTSWFNGEKTVYNCVKGDTVKLPSVIELSRCPSDEQSGIEVCVPVKLDSMWTFHREAANFFKYWDCLPTIFNLDESIKEKMDKFRNTSATIFGEGWSIRPKADGSAEGIAFMGGVPYRIDWNVLGSRMALTAQRRILFDLFQNNDVVLKFKMGEVSFVDSREGLEYNEKTISAMLSRIEGIFDKVKDSIQEKFTNLPNLWEAKITYNSIFATGIIEVEPGEAESSISKIHILDGNLTQLETCFSGKLNWNNVVLTGPDFSHINRFDNSDTSKIHDTDHCPEAPVMITYRKKKMRAKINRCSDYYNNRIVASHRAAIVINDTGIKTGQAMVARYLIFKNSSNITIVHVLNFKDSLIKESFYKEYNFDSIPVIKLSDIISEAKEWNKLNKASRSYSSGNSGGTRSLEYIDMATKRVVEADVPISEIENGGYFVYVGKMRRGSTKIKLANNVDTTGPAYIIDQIRIISDELDADIDRVYIVGSATANAKWFKEAIASGEWTNLWEYFTQNITQIDSYPKLSAIHDLIENRILSPTSIKILEPMIVDKNSPILKLIQEYKELDNYNVAPLIAAIERLHLNVFEKKAISHFSERTHDIKQIYPFLPSYIYDSDSTEKKLKLAANYINAIDFYIDINTESDKILSKFEVVT